MKYKAIIFDLDGVLCSTDKYHYQAWKQLADSIDVYFDETINNRLRGISRMSSLNIILECAKHLYTPAEKERMAEQKNEIYKKLLYQMSPADLSKEVRTTLDALRAKGVLLAIGSSSRNTPLILERLGLAGYFDAVSDGNNITRSKPDPEVFLKAAQYLHLAPEDCLVVEDAAAGIDAAAAGGFSSAGLGEASRHTKVTYPIDRFSDLQKIV